MILIDGKMGTQVSALDRALAYGDGVFRTMRMTNGVCRHWRRHFEKLASDCARIAIRCPPADSFLGDLERIRASDPNCVIKIIVSRGQGGRGYAPPRPACPMRIVASFPDTPPAVDHLESGVCVRWCDVRLAQQPSLAGVKHLNRLENVLARAEWTDPSVAEGLMLDTADWVIEGTMSNLFLLEDGRMVTPRLDRCGVAGVQRERLLALCASLELESEIGAITRERLLAADQVYLVNSVIGLWWVSELGQRRWKRSDLTPVLFRGLEEADD